MKKSMLVFLVCMTSSMGALAQTGFGGSDCGEWVRTPTEGKRQWLLGYMSGLSTMHYLNRRNDDPLDKINSADQIYVWMDNYCKANPLKTVRTGGQELFIELMKPSRS